MCVIIRKPEGVTIGKKTVEDAFLANPDGAGLAFFENGKTRIEKGYFKLEDYWRDINTLQQSKIELILHMRIATAGIVDDFQTHPFRVSETFGECKQKLSGTTKRPVVFHNGIISGYGDKKISDTVEFLASTLARLSPKNSVKLLESIGGSKFAYLHRGKTQLIGDWSKYKALDCSNTHFTWDRKRTPSAVNSGHFYDAEDQCYYPFLKEDEDEKEDEENAFLDYFDEADISGCCHMCGIETNYEWKEVLGGKTNYNTYTCLECQQDLFAGTDRF